MSDQDIAREALTKLAPARAQQYNTWLSAGMALHEAGCSVEDWIRWYPDNNQHHENDCRKKWAGFGNGLSLTTVATLVKWAKEDSPGWHPKRYEHTNGKPLEWNSEIGPRQQEVGEAIDFAEEMPKPGEPYKDLTRYLSALFNVKEVVSFVLESSIGKDGKANPQGRGTYNKTAGDLKKVLETTKTVSALGLYNDKVGAWGRLNPMSGQGVTNSDVVDCRHVLVESDSLPVGKQLALIRDLKLPCAAIVHSGGKSIHAVVKIEAGTDQRLYRERVDYLFQTLEARGFPVDKQCRNPSRLSRWPGFKRGDQVQYLIGVNEGFKSWNEWENDQKTSEWKINEITIESLEGELPDDNLIGDRFLTRKGSWMIVSQSGIGKSTLCLQAAMNFACGITFFGLKPVHELKTLLIQSENSPRDMQEMFVSMRDTLLFGENDLKRVKKNLRIYQCDRYYSEKFCAYLDFLIKKDKPDMVWIDPLLAFIGGEISRMADCSHFLRNCLSPIVNDNNIGLGIIHHTGKPPKKEDQKQGHDLAYLGIGSSELTNWARATSTVMEVEDGIYALEHNKRKARAGCPVKTYMRHSEPPAICWRYTQEEYVEKKKYKTEKRKGELAGLEYIEAFSHDGTRTSPLMGEIARLANMQGLSTAGVALDKFLQQALKEKSLVEVGEHSYKGRMMLTQDQDGSGADPDTATRPF